MFGHYAYGTIEIVGERAVVSPQPVVLLAAGWIKKPLELVVGSLSVTEILLVSGSGYVGEPIDETTLPVYIEAKRKREDIEVLSMFGTFEGEMENIMMLGVIDIDTMAEVKTKKRSKLFPIPSNSNRLRMENRLKRKLRTYFRESLERYRNA